MTLPKWLVLLGVMFLGSLLLRALASDAPPELFPSTPVMLLWAIPLWLTSQLRNPYSKALVLAWVLWFGVGSCNLVASYLAYGDFYLVKAGPPAIVYEVGVTIVVLGLLATEFLLHAREPQRGARPSVRPEGSQRVLPSFYLLFLLLFPFAYLVSMVLTIGQLPMLQGRSFVEEIYETNYGPLYGYGTVLVFSLLLALDGAVAAQRWFARLGWISLLVLYLFIAVADGKRFYAVIALLAIYPIYSASSRGPRAQTVFGALLAIGLGGLIYLGVLVIRSGYELPLSSILPYAFAAVGVEYRDFAYSVAHFTPGEIPGYDWLRSTGSSLLNSQLLAGLGIDKAAETIKGSAYVWRDLLGTAFGIRTGIISELYFAYGVWAAPVLFVVGGLIGFITRRLARPERGATLPFWAVLYAIAILMIVGQSTSTAGLISLVLYTFGVYWLSTKVLLRNNHSAWALSTGDAQRDG